MPIGIGAAILGGAAVSGLASYGASGQQSKAAGASADEMRRQYDQSRADLSPWRSAGKASLSRLLDLMGIGSGYDFSVHGNWAPAAAIDNASKLYEDPAAVKAALMKGSTRIGQAGDTQYDSNHLAQIASQFKQAPTSSDYGSLMKEFTGQDLQNEPGYQFGVQQGEQGINRAALARGGYDSGTTLKSLLKFNQDYAGTKFDQAFNRDQINKNQQFNMLSGISGVGQNTASQLANVNQNYATQSGNAMMAGGDARAAGLVGVGNAINSGIGQYINYTQSKSLLDALKK